MGNEILINKIQILKELYNELLEQKSIYKEVEEKYKTTSYLALQKKAEEVIEFMIRVNKILLMKKGIIPMSYKESFLKLEKLSFNEDFVQKLSELAWFRNRLAHDYIIITKKEIIEKIDLLVKLFNDYLKECIKFIK